MEMEKIDMETKKKWKLQKKLIDNQSISILMIEFFCNILIITDRRTVKMISMITKIAATIFT